MTSSSEGTDHASTSWVPRDVDERLPRSMVAYACDIRWGPFVDMRDQDEDPAYDQFITEFEGRWGPLTPATLARVARLRAPDVTTHSTYSSGCGEPSLSPRSRGHPTLAQDRSDRPISAHGGGT